MNPPTTTITALNRLTRGVRPYPAEQLDDTFKPYESGAAAVTTPGPSRPSTDGGGPPAVLWAGLAALVLAGLGVVGWRRHNPVEAG
jgi:LPXTG-motif cell wall-anchored protein